jgi:SAM-dependent methyltransferase
MTDKTIIKDVRNQYANVAKSGLTNESDAVRSVASAFGYSEEELNAIPDSANMGLSCGNPVALASLKLGEVVVDLGCGGGIDVFLASQKVGPQGRAIGIDMTAEMLERARQGKEELKLTNVEFHQATIDNLPLHDNSVDCVISNCVINLAPDKEAVFKEILRVLKPGGRVAISDIALKQALPPHVKDNMEAYVGCIAGAILIDQYRSQLEQAGFQAVTVTDTGVDLNVYAQASSQSGCCGAGEVCCSPPTDLATSDSLHVVSLGGSATASSKPATDRSIHDGLASVFDTFDANAYAASVKVHAIK